MMRGRFAIAFPYLILAAIAALIVYGNVHRPDSLSAASASVGATRVAPGTPRDPVCNMDVNPAWPYRHAHAGTMYVFCSTQCQSQFAAAPETYLAERCVVCDTALAGITPFPATYQERRYTACSAEHRAMFLADPASYFLHSMWGISPALYYVSIAGVLIVSFVGFEWRARRGRHAAPVQQATTATNGNGAARLAVARAGVLLATGDSGVATLAPPAPPAALTIHMAPPPDPVPDTPIRIDLLRVIPGLARMLRWPPARFLAQAGFAALFALVIAAGLFGNQNPALNLAPMLTWTIWWTGLIVLIMVAGKTWCYVCPWDAVAGWLERGRLWGRGEGLSLGLPWPRAFRSIWPATVLFLLLTWIELGWGVTMRPRVTAYLALGMFAMAFACALLFDRKAFCRYGCLVGRISGMYALFGSLEVRARDKTVCKTCPTKDCYRGNERGDGCPTSEFLGAMDLNTYCIMCGECLKTCPEDNVALNVRPWGTDLLKPGRPRSDEAYLALLMLSITAFHGLTMTPRWEELTTWIAGATGLDAWAVFSVGMTGVLGGPILIYAALVGLSRALTRERAVPYRTYFIRYAYALLPIALFYHLAHNAEHLLMEGPKVVRLLSDPFGFGWDVLGTASMAVPPLISLHTLWYVQVGLVLGGHLYSLWIADHTARHLFPARGAAFRSQIPMLIGMVLFSVFSLWLLKQPMVMRTSAM